MQAKLFGKWRSWRWKAFRGLMVSEVQSVSLPHRATKARRPPTSLSELPLASLAGDFPCHKSYSESILNKIFLSDDDGTLRSGKFLLSKDNCWYMMWFLYLKSLWIQVVIHRTSGSYRSLLFNKTCDFWWDVFTKWIQQDIAKPVSRGSNLMNLFAWSAKLRRDGNFYCKHQISRRHQKIEKFFVDRKSWSSTSYLKNSVLQLDIQKVIFYGMGRSLWDLRLVGLRRSRCWCWKSYILMRKMRSVSMTTGPDYWLT